jgi:predicted acylesterase/phospholipase RssA
MIKYIVLGPGAMGYFIFLGSMAKLKDLNKLNDIEEISGSSAGAIVAFMYLICKGNIKTILDYSIDLNLKEFLKPNISNLIKNYGLISNSKVQKLFTETCLKITGKNDFTFKELYAWSPIKLHLPAYCVDLMDTKYFSVDTSPDVSVIRILNATIAIPFIFEPVKIDNYRFVDGSFAEEIPGNPFIKYKSEENLALKIIWESETKIKNIKSFLFCILYSSLKMRQKYDIPIHNITCLEEDVMNHNATTAVKLKLYILGLSQIFAN